MRPKRREKQARQVVFSDTDDSDDDTTSGEDVTRIEALAKKRAKAEAEDKGSGNDQVKKKAKRKDGWNYRIAKSDQTTIPVDMPDEAMEKSIAFCCFRCHCSKLRKSQIPRDDRFIQSGENSLYHRRCCHKVIDTPKDTWLSPMEDANAKAEENLMKGIEDTTTMDDEKQTDFPTIKRVYNSAKSKESEMYNEDSLAGKRCD
jgi:hypothetical protein